MTSTIEPNKKTVSIAHLDTKEYKTLSRFQMIQLMYVLYSDRITLKNGTPTKFFNLHFSDKRKTRKFWQKHFKPYLKEIFPSDIPERIKDKLILLQLGL